MLELLLYTVMFAVGGYFVLAMFGSAAGNAGWVLCALFAVAAVMAGLLVSYQNTRQRLDRMERKLDELTQQRSNQMPDEVSELEELDRL